MKKFPQIWKMETMDGDGLCPVYLHRWTLLKSNLFSIYLHHFLGNDWSKDPHDHPKTFISIGIWGQYNEMDFTDLTAPITRVFRAPWIRKFPPEYRHRITLDPGHTCWTLCIVGRVKRDWGFWFHSKEWVKWNDYVWGGKGAARKDC